MMRKRRETRVLMLGRRRSGEKQRLQKMLENALILCQNRGVKNVEWSLKFRECRADRKCLPSKKEKSMKLQATRVIDPGANIVWRLEHGVSTTVARGRQVNCQRSLSITDI